MPDDTKLQVDQITAVLNSLGWEVVSFTTVADVISITAVKAKSTMLKP